jgi:histidinol-phosphatase (PHP family)
MTPMPADGHVHSEWSWDAQNGSMERTCERAIELGLPAVAFTEHVDLTPWVVREGELDDFPHLKALETNGSLTPPTFDPDGYFECLHRCREKFPSLRIISGVEIGEPHRHGEEVTRLLGAGRFDRVLGSLHCLPLGTGFSEPPNQFRERPAAEVMRDYLAEIPRLVHGCDAFGVLAHIDYATRYWPPDADPFDPKAFEDEFRHALRALADGGRALEVNTRTPLRPEIVGWWREEGGRAVTFGSDAHMPSALAYGFAEAAAMVEAQGFRPGRDPYDVWIA